MERRREERKDKWQYGMKEKEDGNGVREKVKERHEGKETVIQKERNRLGEIKRTLRQDI